MSDFSRLELTVDSSKAVSSLNNMQTQLNKTESAASSLKNALKTIGLGIGLGALLKESLQLSNTFDAMNKRVGSLFGSTMNKEVKDLTKNFSLSNKAAKELLTTAGKFGTATGQNGDQLKKFSTDLTKLAADIAAFQGIDDPSQILEKLARGTMGQTKVLRELGINIDTTSEKFKSAVNSIQLATGATEAQAKQIYILQEAQRQLAYTQGSAGSQVYSAWGQLLKLMDNFKEILSQVGTILGKLFTPVLDALNKLFSLPVVQQVTAWTIVIGLMIVPLNAVAQAINKSSAAMLDFGKTFVGTTRTNMHELLKFEVALKRFQSMVEKKQVLRLDKKAFESLKKMNPQQEEEYARTIINLSKMDGLNGKILGQIDEISAKLLQADLSQIKWSSSAIKAFTNINQQLESFNRSGQGSNAKFQNLQNLLLKLGITSDQTGKQVDKLNTIMNNTSNEVGAFTSMFQGIAKAFNYIAAIPLTGAGLAAAFGKIKVALGAVGGAIAAVGKVLLPVIAIVVGLHDVFVSIFGTWKSAADEISEEDKKLREQILAGHDETIFWQYENEYELWLSRIWEYTKQFFLDVINLINEVINKITFGKLGLPTDLKTEHTRFREGVEDQIIEDEIKKWNDQYLDKLKLAELEKEKILNKSEEKKKDLLEKELKYAKEALAKINKDGQELAQKIGEMSDQQIKKSPNTYKKLLERGSSLVDAKLAQLRKINQLEEELSKDTTKTVERDVAKSFLSPIQTAISAVNADSVEAVRLQSRELLDNKDDKLLETTRESKEQNKTFFASALQIMNETKDGLKNAITVGANQLEVVQA